ncbi:MAG: lipid-A-disaccharide synthase [Bacteroidales bacterium]
MKYYIIAGEASGDLHGSNLIKEILKEDSGAQIRCWGGDRMAQAGGTLVKHYKDLAFMGFVEVLMNLFTILKNFKFCKADIKEFKPDVLVLIDYPGFNLRMAKYAHKHGLKVFYYIAPQVWAWHTSRVKYVDKLYAILPFEKAFFAKYDVDVEFYGHPLLDALSNYKPDMPFLIKNGYAATSSDPRKIIVVLPGSRKQELKNIFPTMLATARLLPEYRFVVAATKQLSATYYQSFLQDYPEVEIVYDHTYDLLSVAFAAMVKSGTATLETALFQVPEVVCYKGNALSYRIARYLIRNIQYISLVNLILNKEVVKELIQEDLNSTRLRSEMLKILKDPDFRNNQLLDYKCLISLVGEGGASKRIAASIKDEFYR